MMILIELKHCKAGSTVPKETKKKGFMEKYLVFLIAWFGNKFIKHIKIPQGLQLCSVSKQSHLP